MSLPPAIEPEKTNQEMLTSRGVSVAPPVEMHFMIAHTGREAADADDTQIAIPVASALDGLPFDPFFLRSSSGGDPQGKQNYLILGFGRHRTGPTGGPGSIGRVFPYVPDIMGFFGEPDDQLGGVKFTTSCFFSNGAGVVGNRSGTTIARIIDGSGNGWELRSFGDGVIVRNPREVSLQWEKLGVGLSVECPLLIVGKRNPIEVQAGPS